MTTGNPILGREELRRLPFRRRPMAKPGTTLVFQTGNGELTCPRFPLTSGDVWWRGHRVMYVIDLRAHGASFECKLPCRENALQFDTLVSFTWVVTDPLAVVRQEVTNAPGDCQAYLVKAMRPVSRRFPALEDADAEQALASALDTRIPLPGRGLEITGLAIEIRSDRTVIDIELEKFNQAGQLGMHQDPVEFFAGILSGGAAKMSASILAQDPSKAEEAATFMVGLWEKDQRVALDAMKIILEGDHIRLGELDGAVLAAVDRFKAIVARTDAQVSPSLLTGPAPAALPAAESESTSQTASEPAQQQRDGDS